MKRQLIKLEKVFANHMSDKRLVSRICKLLQLNNKKTTQFKKQAENVNIIYPKLINKWPKSLKYIQHN